MPEMKPSVSSTSNQSSSKFINFRIRLEPRLIEPPRWYPVTIVIGAILLGLVFGGILIALVGGNPFASYAHIAKASFGSIGVISDTLVKATPILLTSLACSLAFRMKLWNIGAEGQFIMGAFGASAVALIPIFPAETSSWIVLPSMILAGMIGGALWGAIPGILKAKLNVNEIISTLMLNYIAIAWINYFIFAVWTEGGFQMSRMFEDNAWMPRLLDYASSLPYLRGLTTHAGLLLAIAVSVLLWFIIYRSRWGYEIRLIGDNQQAAKYSGINISLNTILVMMISGALAGLGGMSEVSGVVHRLQTSPIAAGYGFTGIIVAWLSKLNPLAAIIVSILFGALLLAGREIQPSGIPKMIQGIVLVCLIASDFLLRNKLRIVRLGEEL